ncbi:uncharacterized protein TNCV_2444571 [Trichonephila clavipes]|nr:uncharacterized protein TNCV_2444571 [Trichonephila clavipes]
MHLSNQPAFFVHSNVSQHDGKSVPITTFQRDGSDPEVVCITVNHAGLTTTAKDIRSDNYTNARLRLVRLLPNSVPFGYLPFCLAFFSHANVIHHGGTPVSIELSIASIPEDEKDPKVLCITVDPSNLVFAAKYCRTNRQIN